MNCDRFLAIMPLEPVNQRLIGLDVSRALISFFFGAGGVIDRMENFIPDRDRSNADACPTHGYPDGRKATVNMSASCDDGLCLRSNEQAGWQNDFQFSQLS